MAPNVRAAVHVLHEDSTFSEGKLAKDNIYVNVVHTVDGAWKPVWRLIRDGQAMTNEQLGEANSKG